jgi:hypothetical protein
MLRRLTQKPVWLLFVILVSVTVLYPFSLAAAPQAQVVAVQEGFEGAPTSWQVTRDTSGTGSISQVATPVDAGSFAARLATNTASSAALSTSFSDAASSHSWQERPGTYRWQRVRAYIPATTINQISTTQYLTLARYEATGTSARWELRIRNAGQLYVVGTNQDSGQLREFRIYATIPTDRWFELEIGLHSQQGPGVKRAFAFLLDGAFYGWYHQGRMVSETYNRSAVGIVETTTTTPIALYLDQWYAATSGPFPSGPDTRSNAALQQIDYRQLSGERWQIDWSTWGENLMLHPVHGLYSANSRYQSGMNLDRAGDLTSGWGEIEIGWPNGTPIANPASYFGPMIGFRKEINREENLEIIPIGNGNGTVDLVFEAWIGNPIILARWPLPAATGVANSQIPEAGDIIRTRWEQLNASDLHVQAWYFDASTNLWWNAIDTTVNVTAISDGSKTVNYTDGFHSASSITIDSTQYSIRRFVAGELASFVAPGTLITPSPTALPTTPTVTLVPSSTPIPPTATLVPSNTAVAPTQTANPSVTPVPASATVVPSATVQPSLTAVPVSATPIPSVVPTATAQPGGFPATGVLDSFNRANSGLGTNWGGSLGGYSIANNQVDVGSGGDIYWRAATFGAHQEAFVTLSAIDLASAEIDLLLKAQSAENYNSGVLLVWYHPSAQQVQAWTYSSVQGWQARGNPISVTFVAGDQFGARVDQTGFVTIFRNGLAIGTANASAWTYATSSGAIGLWYASAANSLLDSFGGGTILANSTPVPATATAVSTAAPTATPLVSPSATSVPATGVPTNTPIATATTVPLSPTPATNDLIFASGFEGGNFTGWAGTTSNGGNLTVSTAAALVGTYGMRANINSNSAIFATDDSPAAETRYRVRFWFDPNSLSMGNNNAFFPFYGYAGTSTTITRMELRFSGGSYQIRAALINNNTTWSSTPWVTLSDAPHALELDWRAATSSSATNGGLTFWVDGVQQGNISGIANGTRRIDRARLGAVSGLDTSTRGVAFFDAFESRRLNYIGP